MGKQRGVKMKAREIINKALRRLGYTTQNGNEQLTRRIMNRATDIVNDVYADLWRKEHDTSFKPLETPDDSIDLSDTALSVMVYGVAAFIAQSENDGDQQQWWMTVYNDKMKVFSKTATRQDILPRV